MIIYELHIYIYIFNDVPPCFGGFPVSIDDVP